MINVQPYLDKLHLANLYMENKIWCIGRQPFPYTFEYWWREVVKGTQYEYLTGEPPAPRKPLSYYLNNMK